MPQSSQFIGVNSVTNIELDKGVMPAPIIRNADWFGKLASPYRWPRLLPDRDFRRAFHANRSLFLAFYRIVAIGRFTRAGFVVKAI